MFDAVVIILLAGYGISVVSLLWHIYKTATLVPGDDGIAIRQDPPDRPPAIDIVVPVKDEEQNIGQCLRTILAERYPNAHVFVVNDRSTDGTARAVQAVQDEFPQVERLDITHLPEGAYGKPNALEKIAPKLTGDILFFVDSDVLVKPGCFRSIVGYMQDNKLDWFAAYGEPELNQFWERLLAPIFGAMAYSWYDPRKISDPNWPDAIGSGFMVARREAYFAIGGHGAVKGQYDEDSAILRRAKAAKQRVSFVISPNLYTVKLYGTLSRTIRGFSRTLIGGLKTIPRFLITINALQFISLMPIGLLVFIPLLIAAGFRIPYSQVWLSIAFFHLILSNVLVWLIYRTAKLPLRVALLHPLGSAVAIWVCTLAAMDLHKKKPITWRGTSYESPDPTLPSANP